MYTKILGIGTKKQKQGYHLKLARQLLGIGQPASSIKPALSLVCKAWSEKIPPGHTNCVFSPSVLSRRLVRWKFSKSAAQKTTMLLLSLSQLSYRHRHIYTHTKNKRKILHSFGKRCVISLQMKVFKSGWRKNPCRYPYVDITAFIDIHVRTSYG